MAHIDLSVRTEVGRKSTTKCTRFAVCLFVRGKNLKTAEKKMFIKYVIKEFS
jgi:hypothetical protein